MRTRIDSAAARRSIGSLALAGLLALAPWHRCRWRAWPRMTAR